MRASGGAYDRRNEAQPRRRALTAWRDVHGGARIALDLACRTKVEAAAATIEAIVAKGEPVYGVNTGFGKLASVRIGKDDLAALQRNIVLSHASGVGEPIPEAIVRLDPGTEGDEPRPGRIGRALGDDRADPAHA